MSDYKNCPDCTNIGWYVDYTDGPQQVQCEFCYTESNSIFNTIQTLEAKIKELEAERDTAKEWNRQLVNLLSKYTSREISGGDIDYPEDVAELLVKMHSNPKALKEISDE